MTTGIFINTGYHNRRSIRLRGYDYSCPGSYFITMCVHVHAHLVFGDIVGATGVSPLLTGVSPVIAGVSPILELNDFGKIVRDEWERSFHIRSELILDEYVIMPDHIHAIVCIRHTGDTPVEIQKTGDTPVEIQKTGDTPVAPTGVKPRSIGAMIAGFKSVTIKRINELRKMPRTPVWQRNYYDRIIRDEQSLLRIRQYIRNNPANWVVDQKISESGFVGLKDCRDGGKKK
jgi:putative transposase